MTLIPLYIDWDELNFLSFNTNFFYAALKIATESLTSLTQV